MNPYKVLAIGFGLVALAFALAAIDACSPDSWDKPNAPTKDQPCGNGVVCENGNCCPEGFTCAGPHSVGVPAGMCEFIDDGTLSGARDAGPRIVPQRKP